MEYTHRPEAPPKISLDTMAKLSCVHGWVYLQRSFGTEGVITTSQQHREFSTRTAEVGGDLGKLANSI